MKTYRVMVSRIVDQLHDFEVEAETKQEAEQKAIALAYNYVWSDGDVDYVADQAIEI